MKLKVKTGETTMTTTEDMLEITSTCFAGKPGMTEKCELKLEVLKDCDSVCVTAMLENPVTIDIPKAQFIQFAAIIAEFEK